MNTKLTDELNRQIGARLKMRRRTLGMSQRDIGDLLGVNYQQVQKYENGSNRLRGDQLLQLAHHLKVTMDYFFNNLKGGVAESQSEFEAKAATTSETQQLLIAFEKIHDIASRKLILDLVKSYSEKS